MSPSVFFSRKYFVDIILVIGAFAVIVFAFIPGNNFRYPYIFSLVMNAMHFPAGFFVAILSYRYISILKQQHWLLLVLGTALFAAIEIIQPLIGRTASMQDLFVSALGVFFGWVLVAGDKVLNQWARGITLLMGLGILSYLSSPGITAIVNAYQAQQAFPLLVDMETAIYRTTIAEADTKIELKNHPAEQLENQYYLRFNKPDRRWPGIIVRSFQSNWSSHSKFCFEAKGDIKQTLLFVRFNDRYSTNSKTSNTQTTLISDQWGQYCMNIKNLMTRDKRALGITEMSHVIFYLDHKKPEAYIDLDNIQLK